MSVLKIGYIYPELLNLYGDNGNVEILAKRAAARNINVQIKKLDVADHLDSNIIHDVNIMFMGGGPDSSQKALYEDLLNEKGPYIKDYIENNGVGLFICGSYQMLGHYYKAADGTVLSGLGVFDLYTQHFGKDKPRCIGNTTARLAESVYSDDCFPKDTPLSNYIVGFENHGGRTYLANALHAFAQVEKGYGNNGEDTTEGVHYKNSIGTYFHGPILSKNPHFADFLICKALGMESLPKLDDRFVYDAHIAVQKLKQ